MPTPEELRRLWPGLDDDQRQVLAATQALLEALEEMPVPWALWVIDLLAARLPDGPEPGPEEDLGDLSVWEAAIEGWEDECHSSE